jgi:hypothetical protein
LTFTPLLLAPVIPPGLVTFLPFLLIIAVFYLMLVRPETRRPHHHHRRHARDYHLDQRRRGAAARPTRRHKVRGHQECYRFRNN